MQTALCLKTVTNLAPPLSEYLALNISVVVGTLIQKPPTGGPRFTFYCGTYSKGEPAGWSNRLQLQKQVKASKLCNTDGV